MVDLLPYPPCAFLFSLSREDVAHLRGDFTGIEMRGCGTMTLSMTRCVKYSVWVGSLSLQYCYYGGLSNCYFGAF